MKCPYCNQDVKNIGYHLSVRCKIRPHYTIVNEGNIDCKHEFLKLTYEQILKNGDNVMPKITIRCQFCSLHYIFNTFEKVWLPNLKGDSNATK